MKKIMLFLIAAVAAFSASAITIGEAFEKISALPGVAISDVPGYDCVKDGMDWGKVAMLMGASKATADDFNAILADITDELALDTVAQGSNTVKAYTAPNGDRTQALVTVSTPNGIIAIYAQGDENVVNDLNIN